MKLLRIVFLASLVACGQSGEPAKSPTASAVTATAPSDLPLLDEAGASAPVAARVSQTPFTVLLFFTPECPVQKAHDARVRELLAAYGPRGVTFFGVSSDVGADVPAVREEVRRRALGLPVLEDRGAALAKALGVEYSTHVVLLDRERRIHYSGAIDGDRSHLTERAEHYLRNALDAVLAGRPVAKATTEPLGCPFRTE